MQATSAQEVVPRSAFQAIVAVFAISNIAYLTEDEVNTVLQVPEGQSLRECRDRAILELLYASGLRVSELTGLNDADLYLPQRFNTVPTFGF